MAEIVLYQLAQFGFLGVFAGSDLGQMGQTRVGCSPLGSLFPLEDLEA